MCNPQEENRRRPHLNYSQDSVVGLDVRLHLEVAGGGAVHCELGPPRRRVRNVPVSHVQPQGGSPHLAFLYFARALDFQKEVGNG